MSNVNVGNIHGTATLNASQFVSGANQAVGALQQLELATAANWWGLQNLGRALAIIPAAVATGVGASINAYMQWEDAIAGVERTTYEAQRANETAAQAQERNAQTLEGIVDGLKEIASTTPVAASTLAGIAESAGALGVAEQDILSFTKVVADLDATTDLTANSAAVNLARISGLTGVAGQGYDNLASSILEVGRSTAATEQEIVDIANRIAGISSVANLSAADVIGLAGALRSAGVRSEQGGTAFQKTFADIIQAVSNGGDELELFATISGKTAEQLQVDFQENAADAFVDFIAGLGQLNAAGENVIGVLNQLGITEARQTQTLLLLAEAETQVVNENLKVSSSLDTSRRAFADGTAVADIAAKRYRTLSSQLQLLRNEIFLAAQGFGATFAPAIIFIVERLRDFITGLNALPSPLKIAVGVILGLSTALLGLAAAAILVGPRIVLAVTALRQLGSSSGAAVGGLGATAAAMGLVTRQAQTMAISTAQATAQLSALQIASANQGLAQFAASAGAAGGGAAALGAGAASASTGLSGMTLWVSRLGKGLGVLGAVLTVGSILLTVFGNSLRQNENAATAVVQSNAELFNILSKNNNTVDQSTRAWLEQSDMWPRIQQGIDRYGHSVSDVQALIQGTADQAAYKKFLEDTTAAYESGDKGAKEYADSVITLSRIFAESRKEAESILAPIRDITEANGDMEDSFNTEDEIRELEKLRKALEDQATAHVDYVRALQSQARAQFDLLDAQRAYREALADAQDPTRVLADLERRLASARRNAEKSQNKLADAEERLATARADQQKELTKALQDAEDAQESYSDAQQRLRDAEEELAELRAGPELKNIVKATNDLRNAQLRLLRANQDVADAEWYLNYLREEGASDRDIRDAELALQEARQEVNNANQDITESEEELARARQGASAREIADAEEAVSDALRETQRAYDDILEKEEDVARIRTEIANDTAYRDAELEYAEARDDAAEAAERAAEAEQALRDARDFGIARNLKQAELDLTDALYASAEANAEARIAQLRMNGVYVDAGTEAAILADELGKLTGLAPTAAQQRRLRDFIDILRAAPEAGPPIEPTLPNFDDITAPAGEIPIPQVPDLEEFTSAFEEFADSIPGATRDLWKTLWDEYGKELGIMALTLIGGGIVAAILGVPAIIGAAIVGLAILIAELFGDEVVKWLTQTAGPAIGDFFTKTLPRFFTETVPKGLGAALEAVGRFFTETLPRFFRDLIPRVFQGIAGQFLGAGSMIIRGLWDGINRQLTTIWTLIESIPKTVLGIFSTAGSWLLNAGINIVNGLRSGLNTAIGGVLTWFINLPPTLFKLLGDLVVRFASAGRNIINGIANGINAAWRYLRDVLVNLPKNMANQLWQIATTFHNIGVDIINGILSGLHRWGHLIVDFLMDIVSNAWDSILRFFGIRSPSKQMAWVAQMLMFGFRDGMEKYGKLATKAALGVANDTLDAFGSVGLDQAISDLLATDAARLNVAASAGSGLAAGAAPAAATTIINEGDTFNLEAITDADPSDIVDEFMWQKLVRTG